MELNTVIAILGSIAGVSAPIMAYVMLKRATSDEAILDKLSMLLNEAATNQEMQQKIYIVGGILGQGIRQGVGMGGVKGGKFKMEDLFGALAGSFIQRMFPQQGQPQQEAQPSNTSMGIES